ncbi:3-hydroxyacyl-CoA dehydrogenase NAD-binding domain-containing protein [Paenibacillus oryzisoli]|uniref:3-hydroxyacyl-CoA dehydrogenase family protein n=1 Tax=Paenibacillus oryzisoli TaxID=1850517 RepID=UPI003D2E44EA
MVFKKIGVVGGGTMGQGISEMLAAQGLDVFLAEKSPEKLDQAIAHITISLDKQIERWALTESEKKTILSKIKRASDLSEMADCDLVIESISEDLNAKKHMFFQLNQYCPPHVLLATNTSTLSVTEIAAVTTHPERVIGLHFLHPVAKVGLVEIVRAMRTSDETYRLTQQFVDDHLHKKGIAVNESPGYITTRLICTLINEAMHTLSEGIATAEDIDQAMKIGYEFKYGPLEMCDRFGLDAVLAALEGMFREYGDIKYRPSFLLKQMVRAGHLGTKTGIGFFRYDKDGDRL